MQNDPLPISLRQAWDALDDNLQATIFNKSFVKTYQKHGEFRDCCGILLSDMRILSITKRGQRYFGGATPAKITKLEWAKSRLKKLNSALFSDGDELAKAFLLHFFQQVDPALNNAFMRKLISHIEVSGWKASAVKTRTAILESLKPQNDAKLLALFDATLVLGMTNWLSPDAYLLDIYRENHSDSTPEEMLAELKEDFLVNSTSILYLKFYLESTAFALATFSRICSAFAVH